MRGMDIFRVADGRITDRWAMEDLLALLVQLGAVTLPGSPATS